MIIGHFSSLIHQLPRKAFMLMIAGGIVSLSPFAQAATIQKLGPLPEYPDGDSYALGVSNNGIVVGYAKTEDGEQAFRWTQEGGMVSLGFVETPFPALSRYSRATGITPDGSTICGYSDARDAEEPFIWTAAEGMVSLGKLAGGNYLDTVRAYAISANGTSVVGSISTIDSYKSQAFVWQPDPIGLFGIGKLAEGYQNYARATGVSADGSVVVGVSSSSTEFIASQAFRWTSDGGMIGLGNLSATYDSSRATGVSGDGSVVIGVSTNDDGNEEAFRWTDADGMVGLGDLPGGDFESMANGISADGSIIVGYGWPDDDNAAFVWDAQHGMRSLAEVLAAQGLDVSGIDLYSVDAISADGTVLVGSTGKGSYGKEAWIVTGFNNDVEIVQEPPVTPEPTVLDVFNGGLFAGGTDVYYSDWFGFMYTANFPWVYNYELGWFYIIPEQTQDSLWLYNAGPPERGWMYTADVYGGFFFYELTPGQYGWNWLYTGAE